MNVPLIEMERPQARRAFLDYRRAVRAGAEEKLGEARREYEEIDRAVMHEIAETMAMSEHVDGAEYVVLGNKRERMAQYGNAVTPPAMRLLVGRILEALDARS